VALRKESTVLLAVFGPNMGTPMLAHVALLVFICQILIQLIGHPYMQDQQKLQILDIASICVCWFTMWSGFFFYTPRPPEQKSALEFLTVLVFLVNTVHMLVLIGSMFTEICKEKKESRLIQSVRRRTSNMVPNVVRNMRKRTREMRAKHRLSFDFENPSLGAVAPSAGDVQMVNLGGGEGGGEASTTTAGEAGETAVDIAEEEVAEEAAEEPGAASLTLTSSSSSSSSSSSATAGEVKTTDSARSSKTKRKKKKGSKNRPETLPGSFMAAPPPAPTRGGAVESSTDVVDAGATRRKRLASIHARKKEIMQHKNPMKNKHTL